MPDARACLVTGYVRLDLPNRSHADYGRLGAELLMAPADVDRQVFAGTPESCWHWRLSDGATLPAGNPEKDTRAFHAVQHEKTAWVAAAAERTEADILVWMDYGILHVPGITPALVTAFLERAARQAPRDRGPAGSCRRARARRSGLCRRGAAVRRLGKRPRQRHFAA